MDGFWEAVDAHGSTANPYRAGFLQFVAVADSDAEAERLYAEPRAVLLQPLPAPVSRLRQSARLHQLATIRPGIEGQIKQAADRNKELQDLTWSQILERGYVVAGSPDTVVQQLTRDGTARCASGT